MCKAMKDIKNEAAEENMLQTIWNLTETLKFSAEEAMKIPKIDQWGVGIHGIC